MTQAIGTVRVVSKRSGGVKSRPGETVIAADRRCRHLGNPHILHDHNNAAERMRVIEAHSRDLDKDLASNGPIDRYLHTLAARVAVGENIALECWCAPRPCHADRYAQIITQRAVRFSR